ncbi:vesicle-associated protein 1-3-like isoform X2 [Rhodamnia argentea]|uniref:Vesicle-associated protein 1-3-like isoform X2 n=1 Tax=Rhodamnia argentea TaxID=178133 RepID=A0ABM3HYA1_9MYRT|nr:vesicle-associated protein 1-3-like isoform X2 [Rhodamnia argentea]
MVIGNLLDIHPTELKFTFELRRQSSCSMQLSNKTDECVAFKVKTTNPKKYCVRPNSGVVPPGVTCNFTVTMQAPKEAPPDMQCRDKFLIQSIVAPYGATMKEITPEMFDKEYGKTLEEFKLRVVYIPANPPSPIPEESEEGSSPTASPLEDGNKSTSLFDVTRSLETSKKSLETWSIISKLTEEKALALQQRQKLSQELDLLRKEVRGNRVNSCFLLLSALASFFESLLDLHSFYSLACTFVESSGIKIWEHEMVDIETDFFGSLPLGSPKSFESLRMNSFPLTYEDIASCHVEPNLPKSRC